jgi:hypothetical protein
MSSKWPELPYDAWSPTCDTLHAHTQVLGKLAVVLAPPKPQLQHAALRLSARGWETAPLPAPDGSGAFAVAFDLRAHEALVERVDGRVQRISLKPNRSVATVTHDVLEAVGELVGEVQINLDPQETPWQTPLDEDTEHATYDPAAVAAQSSHCPTTCAVRSNNSPRRDKSHSAEPWRSSIPSVGHTSSKGSASSAPRLRRLRSRPRSPRFGYEAKATMTTVGFATISGVGAPGAQARGLLPWPGVIV